MARTCMAALLFVVALAGGARADLASDSLAQSAFDHFYNLEYAEAAKDFRQATQQAPNSPDPWIYVAQALFYESLYDSGITEGDLVHGQSSVVRSRRVTMPPAREAEFSRSLQIAQTMAQAQLSNTPNDSKALFEMGGISALRASYALLVKHAWFTALKETNASRRYFDKVKEIDPSNCDAVLVPAINEYVVGTLPWVARLAARSVGLSGNKKRGLSEIERVAECGQRARVNAAMLAAEIERREKHTAKAAADFEKLIAAYPRNFRLRIDLAMTYAEAGQHDKAVAVLRDLNDLLARGAPGYAGLRASRIRHEYDDAARQIAGQREIQPVLAGAWLPL